MIVSAIGWLVKLGLGGIVDRIADVIEKRGQQEVDKAKLRSDLTAEYLRQVVEETRIMADFNKAKLGFPWFWCFAAMFLVPLGLWWTAVILDSVFGFSWDVADLPTPQMQQWAGDMIRWVFFVGSGVAGLRALIK